MEGTYGQRHCLFTAICQLTYVGSRLSLSLSHDQVCIVTLFSCATALSSRHCFIPQLHSPPGHWSMLIRLLLTRFMLRFPGRISSRHIPACPPAISSYRPITTSLSSLSWPSSSPPSSKYCLLSKPISFLNIHSLMEKVHTPTNDHLLCSQFATLDHPATSHARISPLFPLSLLDCHAGNYLFSWTLCLWLNNKAWVKFTLPCLHLVLHLSPLTYRPLGPFHNKIKLCICILSQCWPSFRFQ